MRTKIANKGQPRPRANDSQQSKVRLTLGGRGSRRESARNTSSTLGINRSIFVARILPSFIILIFSVIGYYIFFIRKYDWLTFTDFLPHDKDSNITVNILRPLTNDSREADNTQNNYIFAKAIDSKLMSLNISQSVLNRNNFYAIGKLHKVVLQGQITLYWKSIVELKSTKGVVVLLSSCHGTGLEWWSVDDSRTLDSNVSKSLPVENNIAKTFVKHGYWVISMPAVEKRKSSGCWVNEDYVHVATAVNFMQLQRQRYALEETTLPVHILGIMNGGVLISNNFIRWQSLPSPLVFSSIILMNCGIWNRDYEKKPSNYPPVLFIDFQRNGDLALHNNQTVAKLQKVGISAKHLSSDPLPLTSDFFYLKLFNRGSNITKEESRIIFEAMLEADFIWPGSGILVQDVAGHIQMAKLQRTLQKALPRVYLKLDALEGIFSPTLQILRQAWGFRETNDEFADEMVDWIRSHELLIKK